VFNPMFGATSMIASNREGANSGLTNLSFHTCVVNDDPPIERMRLTSGGNLLIGTTTDGGHKLEVYEAGDSLSIGDNTNSQTYARFANTRTMVGYGGANAVFQSGLGKGINFNVNNDSFNSGTAVTIPATGNVLIGTTVDSGLYKIDVAGKARVQSVLELEDVLTLNQISTPSDPASGKSSIYMDSADGAIKVKINVGGTVVTRTIASFE